LLHELATPNLRKTIAAEYGSRICAPLLTTLRAARAPLVRDDGGGFARRPSICSGAGKPAL